ncbi:uncharacterized protein GBIM_05257 [Gryllus bimaculatus]|nr:uncharacterized protein GBIM_05257 [Gryllus bimaculatus]
MADTERLIELVRNHSHLYDMRHDDYKDVVKKAESWKAIAETLNQTNVLHPNVSVLCDGDYNDDDSVKDESKMPPPKKKLKESKEVSGSVDKIISYLRNEKENKLLKNLDHIDNLFLSYADTFKKFSPTTQAVIKMELAQLFGKAELRELDAPNPPVPSPP